MADPQLQRPRAGGGKHVSAGCPAIAPFKERLASAAPTNASSSSASGRPKPPKAAHPTSIAEEAVVKHKQQGRAAAVKSRQRHSTQTCRGLSAVHAVSKVAAAEAAVSAAAVALIPSRAVQQPPHTNKAGSNSSSSSPAHHQHKLGQHRHAADHVAAGAGNIASLPAARGLQVQGKQTGPHKGSPALRDALCQAAAETAAETASCADPSTSTTGLHACLTGDPQALTAADAAPSAQQPVQLDMSLQQLLQALPLCCTAVTGSSSSSPCASAQLAAHGLCKRIKARLRSAYGPPAFQRGPPPPKPASPRPVELTAEMLTRHSPDATSPASVAIADLGSCYISRIAAPSSTLQHHVHSLPAGTTSAAGAASRPEVAEDQQLPLQSFSSLVALDLSDNRLQCFAGLAVLPSLQQLNLSANRLQSLHGLQLLLGSGRVTGRNSSPGGRGEQDAGLQQDSCSHLKQLQEPSNNRMAEEPPPPCEGAGVGEAAASERELPQPGEQGVGCSLSSASQGASSSLYDSTNPSTTAAAACLLQQLGGPAGGFSALEVLDLSYNLLSGEQLLGAGSPLGQLPRLSELYAAGSSITTLPAQLACFRSLTMLSLQHNQLQLAAIQPLGQLPALQQLDVSHNPFTCPPQVSKQHTQQAEATGVACFPELQVLDVSYSRLKQLQPLQQLLGTMQRLAVLRLVHTPLSDRCRTGKVHEQNLQRPGLTVVMSSGGNARQHSRQQHHAGLDRAPVLKIPEPASSQKVLAAASRAALVSLPHEQLVAAFDRVAADISNWQQLAPVPEEDGSWEWQEGAVGTDNTAVGTGQEGLKASAEEERIVDKTFLTGVGITGQLPGDEDVCQDATSSQALAHDQWQDPTERLAVALGLQVSQLAHMTGCSTGNPDASLHRLRHALTHPLVDPDAGERPQQHHMRSTAATAAKQQPPRLTPLPLSPTLSTRIAPVQDVGALLSDMRGRLAAMQGTLLPQLQAKASQMTQPATAMAASTVLGHELRP